jgi:hypothetical protein
MNINFSASNVPPHFDFCKQNISPTTRGCVAHPSEALSQAGLMVLVTPLLAQCHRSLRGGW